MTVIALHGNPGNRRDELLKGLRAEREMMLVHVDGTKRHLLEAEKEMDRYPDRQPKLEERIAFYNERLNRYLDDLTRITEAIALIERIYGNYGD